MMKITKCYTNGSLRKIDHHHNSDMFDFLFDLVKDSFPNITKNGIVTIGDDFVNNEHTVYGSSELAYEEPNSDIMFVGIKISKKDKSKRIKNYYLGNHFDVPSDDNVFLSGKYNECGSYTVYVSKHNKTVPSILNIGEFLSNDYTGITYNSDGSLKYITEYIISS